MPCFCTKWKIESVFLTYNLFLLFLLSFFSSVNKINPGSVKKHRRINYQTKYYSSYGGINFLKEYWSMNDNFEHIEKSIANNQTKICLLCYFTNVWVLICDFRNLKKSHFSYSTKRWAEHFMKRIEFLLKTHHKVNSTAVGLLKILIHTK